MTIHWLIRVFDQAPVAIALLEGPDYRIKLANAGMYAIWQLPPDHPSVIGQPVFEAFPTIAGLGLEPLLDQVRQTDQPIRGTEVPYASEGKPTTYVDFVYSPVHDEQGNVNIVVVATDVTAQRLARQQLEASTHELTVNLDQVQVREEQYRRLSASLEQQVHERTHALEAANENLVVVNNQQNVSNQQLEDTLSTLHNAVELAQLGRFSVEVSTNLLTASDRVVDWFGFDSPVADAEAFIQGVGESERDYVRTSLYNALKPGSTGRYDVEHSVIHAKTGRRVILHALGQVYYTRAGQPVRIEGTAQDITRQRELQTVLEQQVQQQTQALAASNEELAAINEELTATNDELSRATQELTESNDRLSHSNESLQRFAYVASHDLQEPLRKIQQFGDLLKSRLPSSSTEDLVYLERMQLAAGRMSRLIKDLLNYSRMATQPPTPGLVSLDQVVQTALLDLDLIIEETGAQVRMTPLPTIPGDAQQLGQLFTNLLSNALKFRRADVVPLIELRVRPLPAEALPKGFKPARPSTNYQLIEVVDNGIGFEEKYLDRMFEVFQRLHGRNAYAGTGIGLAIAQQVAINHGGLLTAHSKPGEGATFLVYLPA